MKRIKNFDEYLEVYNQSIEDPLSFWSSIAEDFEWIKKWDTVLEHDWGAATTKWFNGAVTNITLNCLDRHVAEQPDKTAITWVPNSPDVAVQYITYKDLLDRVCQAANCFKELGVGKGDRVCLYMPMIPELAISVLACARIGAIHSVVFAGFSAQALADRIKDAEAKLIITSDGNFRGSKVIPVKEVVDTAIEMDCRSVEKVLVVKRTGSSMDWNDAIDVSWDDLVPKMDSFCSAEPMSSEDTLFILYTSGSTGKPKGVVHSCGGYMVYTAYSFKQVFQYKDDDVYWCTADIGWITGHSYIVYGPLLNSANTVMFEGVPTYPDAGRFWSICEHLKVNQFYTAPTAIRALQAFGDDYVNRYDLSNLKVLGTVGEPINEEAWEWYYRVVGQSKIPIVDTWWQTETGGIMISALAGITPLKPSYASLPLPGIEPCLVDENGTEITGNNVEGLLCVKSPWPSMIRTTYGDHARCKQVYFSDFPKKYFTGDGARRDENGYYRIIGRVDDVINVSGHRMGTAEIENAINSHPLVVESAVVGVPHSVKGQGVMAFVILLGSGQHETGVEVSIEETVVKAIGKIARPEKISIVSGLPKTRSGKIMRRLLRKIASGQNEDLGDISTLLNPDIIDEIKGK